MHPVQPQVQSTDSPLLTFCFSIKEANDSSMIDPGDDEDINIELSKTFLGYVQTLLSISYNESKFASFCLLALLQLK